MASLYKPTITAYRLPDGKFRTPDGKRVTKNTAGAVKVSRKSKIWYGKYKTAGGKFARLPLCADKTASKQMLAKLVTEARLGTVGLGDRYGEHRNRPLREHLAEWEAALLAQGAGHKHIRQTLACACRVLDGCGFEFLADLSAVRVQAFLAKLRERRCTADARDEARESYTKRELAKLLGVSLPAIPPMLRRHRLQALGNGKARRYPRATAEALLELRRRGQSIKTSNLYLAAVKQFCHWLVQNRRLAESPLAHLSGGNVGLDRRHDRRPLAEAELRLLLETTRRSGRTFRGLKGRDRHFLYLAAMGSGFRCGELAALTPEAFTLEALPPTINLCMAFAKNKRAATQPLHPDVADALRGYLAAKPAGRPVWPGTWTGAAAEMLRHDLEACDIPYVIDGPESPLYADFHALRHSYVLMLDRAGATLKEAMQLARHSDPKLTMARYGRVQLHDLGGAVERLPDLLGSGTGALAATGTDPRLDRALTKPVRTDGRSLITRDSRSMRSGEVTDRRKSLEPIGDADDCDRLKIDDKSSPRGTLFVTMRAFGRRDIEAETPLKARTGLLAMGYGDGCHSQYRPL
jgi:integrase